MEIKVKSYSSQSSLISSIIFFIIGAILFTSADKVMSFISIAFGILIAIVGIIELIIFFIKTKKEESFHKNRDLAFGIVALIIAGVFIFASSIIEQFIRFIIGAWILFTGITRFINVLSISPKSRKFLPLLIVSILLMGVGVYTIIIGDVILSSIGIIMMIYSVIEIIGFIFYTKDTKISEEPGTTTLIVPENDTKEVEKIDKKKVKDVK